MTELQKSVTNLFVTQQTAWWQATCKVWEASQEVQAQMLKMRPGVPGPK